ncbi:hypothetical protein E4L95_09150 [Paracoccus liaowanqingii]|uniref:DUF6894 domain-containing protein n=1 Tax=Paracoccus liaowanqingii TaxID=2560053 RepID=A0A4Z1CLQ4_9RHOB|nr:hypothetical protein [Paracoccus liaowanqingii]TGN61768.1 hypothetical protein E4L95_09150 [Paracoccus liaowanqingii]
MPRFYFHLDYPSGTTKDPEGSDHPNLEAARIEARVGLRELAADYLVAGRLLEPHGISICNAAGECLTIVSAAEAITEIIPLDVLRLPASH